MHKRRLLSIIGCIALSSILMVGCSSDDNLKGSEDGLGVSIKDDTTKEETTDDVLDETKTKEELEKEKEERREELEAEQSKLKKVNIWIPNIEYISSGDESLEKLLKVEVDSVPTDSVEDDYMLMLKTLNLRGDSPIQVVDFKSATLKDGKLTIDMGDATNLGIGGSTSEYIILEQIKATMFNNFEEVKSIQFTVEGKIVDTFLGHIEITEAFER